MNELLEAVKASSPEQVVAAFAAAIEAAYANNPSHGYHAAFAALASPAAPEPESAPVDAEVPEAE